MRRRLARLVRTALLVGVGTGTTLVLLPTAINIGTGGTAPPLLRPLTAWMWPLIGVLLAGTVAVAVRERSKGEKNASLLRWAKSKANRDFAVQNAAHYFGERLAGSLAEHVRLRLGLDEVPTAVARPVDMVIEPRDGVQSRLPLNADMTEVFDDANGLLLILGAPGAGKTTLLLELSRDLASRAKVDPEQPVPVVLDLSSWAMSGWSRGQRTPVPPGDFRKWLWDALFQRYRIPAKVGRTWAETGKLALMLDGLDEVPQEHRARCVREIKELLGAFPIRHLVVCSRSQEYDDLPRQLQLHSAVTIRPLVKEQVRRYFTEVSPRLDGVRTALHRDPELWQLLDSPLMLNIMVLAYQDRSADELVLSGSLDQRRRKLFNDYIVEVLARRRAPHLPFTSEQVLRGLRFLAKVSASPLCNDLTARRRLPALVCWLEFLPAAPFFLMFERAVPGLFAGGAGAFSLSVGTFLGPGPGVAAVIVAVGFASLIAYGSGQPVVLLRGAEVARTRWGVAAMGAIAGAAVSFGLCGLGAWGSLVAADWPVAVRVIAVLVVTFTVLAGMLYALTLNTGTGLAAGLIGALASALLMVWMETGPSVGLLFSLGAGIAFGAVGGIALVALGKVMSELSAAQREKIWADSCNSRFLLIPVVAGAAMLGSIPGLLSGGPLGWSVLNVVFGLSVGGLAAFGVAEVDDEYFNSITAPLAEFLARILVLSDLPVRRATFLRFSADRSLVSTADGEYRFMHLLIRDHFLTCDPEELAEAVRARVHDLNNGSALRNTLSSTES